MQYLAFFLALAATDSPTITLNSDYPSLLNLLFALGTTTNKSIAFEAYDQEVFDRAIHLHHQTGTPQKILKQALTHLPTYCATDQTRLLRIAPCSPRQQTWLDYRIHSISWGKNVLQAASNGVYLSLANQINPTPGWGGHFQTGAIDDAIGPYELKNQTVRALLDRFAQDSTGAIWITDKPFTRNPRAEKTDAPERFWNVVEYHDDPRQSKGNLETIRSGAAQAFHPE